MFHRLVFLAISLSIALLASAQQFTQTGLGTDTDDTGQLYIIDDKFYVLGTTKSNGSEDLLLMEINENLEIIWSKSYPNPDNEGGTDLIPFLSNELMIAGYGRNGGSTILMNTDSDGSENESFSIGSTGDRLDKLIETNDNGFLALGQMENLVPGNRKAAIMKFDINFEMQWRHYYDYSLSPDFDSNFGMSAVAAIQLAGADYLFLTNYANINNSEASKIRLIKTNERGYLEWVTGYQGGNMDRAEHMIRLSNGDYIISATSNSYGDGDTDILIIRIDNLGNLKWSKTFGTSEDEAAGSLVDLGDGGFAVCGTGSNIGFGGTDALLLQFDGDGQLQSAHAYGGNENDNASRLVLHENQFYLSGSTKSFGEGDWDVFIVKANLDGTSGECTVEVTDAFEEKPVSPTFFEGNYAHSVFDQPTVLPKTDQNLEATERYACYECPGGTKSSRFLCEDQTLTLDLSSNLATSYKWQDGSTGGAFEVSSPGTYWVETTTELCVFRDTILVSLISPQQLDLGPDISICRGDVIQLNASINGAVSYEWQDGSLDSVLNVSEPGTYSVTVLTTCGAFSDVVEVVLPEFDYAFPNVFTPNGDGYNEFFEVRTESTNIQSLRILNRSGKTVYESYNYTNHWDGDGQPAGVYFYIFEDRCTRQRYKGWLQIIR